MTGGSTRAAEHDHASAARARERRWWLLVAVGALVVVASYVGLVLTPAGQAVENAALRGADQVGAQARTDSDEALASITVASLAVACAVIAVVGLLRRSIPLATAALGTVVASLLVTEVLKRVVLPRPALVEASAAYTGNSFPSGHTTIALGVLAAALLLATWRSRGVVMFFVASWAVAIAGYTITSKWHRLSDTLGSAGIVLVVASLAALWLHRRGLVRRVETGGHRARIWLVVVPLALSLLVGVGLAAVLLVATGDLLDRDPVTEDNVFLAFQLLAGVGSVATTLALWWSWHRLEVATPPDDVTRRPLGRTPPGDCSTPTRSAT
ncbi:phosphatase PAP2 family protein [Cellulomonas xiejunii]|uniref:Phosphatase PAP2 family protein n=1 Tax=Cellulomonas xiejunii TaxID=2968083 RepID=A0ABY5KPQ9_9CELL|nr:phosphatase PAP2 family protein [Cellulomonas xiejunii]MCC2321164.1 phosphatase PAP2 family protein [Cellulomonas xiejunii]UUI71754.1 phosphatase PAP2 family protein [Cellulomonas xiejunii]